MSLDVEILKSDHASNFQSTFLCPWLLITAFDSRLLQPTEPLKIINNRETAVPLSYEHLTLWHDVNLKNGA